MKLKKAIKYQNNKYEQEPCEDTISRTRAIERLKLNFPISDGADNSRDRHRYMQALADIQAIREMPSVTPQPKTGHWINAYPKIEPNPMFMYAICSVCDFKQSISIKLNFCPNCGARMVETQESEDKE